MGDLFGLIVVRPFGIILMKIYEMVGSYGLAVIAFAILAKILLFPLSYKSKKSMLKMNAIQGRMREIQRTFANNRIKMNEEMQKLYEQEGISPMSGCLPTVITLPIMMGLYYAVQKPLTFMIGLGMSDITLLGQKVGIDVATVSAKSVTYQLEIAQKLNQFVEGGHFNSEVLSLSDNIKNLLIPIDFNFFGLDLAQTPQFSKFSILWLIPILSGLTALLSSYIMQKMQKTQTAGTMKTMLYMMPLMSVYFGFIFPASIGVYWVANNVLTTLQEVVLTKYLNRHHPVLTEAEVREQEHAKKRAAHEEKMKRIAEQGAKPNPNTSRKKRERK